MTDAEIILRASLDKIAVEQDYHDPEYTIKQVLTGGANYTSFLYAITISSKGKDDLSLFAKVAASGEKIRSMAPMNMFDVEYVFYMELLQIYRELEEKHEVPEHHRLKVPKIYTCSPTIYEETVVMENLVTKGYTLHDRFKSVDWDYASKSFTELAKLHALSIALKQEKPEYFEELQERFKFKAMNEEVTQLFMDNSIKQAMSVIKEENKERLLKFLNEQNSETFLEKFLPGERPVIRHGDYRPSNLMNRMNENGGVDIIPVDYQTLICGSPVIDLFYFIFLGTDKQFRDKYFDRLLDHYYTELSAAITRLGVDPEEKYSKKNFDDDVKEHLSYGLMVATTILSLVTVDAADAPEVNQDMDFTSFTTIKLNELFADRFNEIIDDYIRWEIL